MVNINTLNAALWKIQIAKAEQASFDKRNGLEGTWQATQNMANLASQEAALQNAINLHKIGQTATRIDEVEYMANRIMATLPAVH